MLTTSCPNCGSPLTFRSGAALTTVCAACQTCVVREGDVLRDYGKIARFQRELSPIQIDARGKVGERGFRVVGVLRKARERVRWNEWYIAFDDGGDGWIGEGNGQWFVYAESAPAPGARNTGAGGKLEAGGATWRVTEASQAAVVAGEGQLPFPVLPNRQARYLDLREVGGARVGTLDFADDPPTLWIGRDVTLVQLQMEGLRPFAGWSDPALVHFAGPEIQEVRSLQCEACGASNAVRSPGQSQRLACGYCGTLYAIEADEGAIHAEVLQKRAEATFRPVIPLGTRGTLKGVDWVVIGAMVRSTIADGMEYSWLELLLHNPYRGFAWLVQDSQRHWSFVEPARGELPRGEGRHRRWRGRDFVGFQGGPATVKHVLGEFTWEVAVGDRAHTADFIAPPFMLSMERTDEEITWSIGQWLPHTEIERAFGVRVPPGEGVAPHQPNPYKDPERVRALILRGVALFAVALLLLGLALTLPARAPLFQHELLVVAGENAWATEPIRLADESVVRFDLDGALPSDPDVTISFIHAESGTVWDWTTYGSSDASAKLAAGTWTGRVALPTAAAEADVGKVLTVRALRDPGFLPPAVLFFFFTLLAPLAYLYDVSAFEQRRWANAGDF